MTTIQKRIIAMAAAVAVVLVTVKLLALKRPESVAADEAAEVIRLHGVVRDFVSSHADFGIDDGAMLGHCVQNLDVALDERGRPVHVGGGQRVTEQWIDVDDNPIRPYYAGPGLPGGHFDVDVFDEPTHKKLYHKHEFDDAYDVTYVDIAHDPKLLFDAVIGDAYPNDLRATLLNPHHSSGTFTIEAGGILRSGRAQDGFEVVFRPSELTQFRLDFERLLDLRGTQPSKVQNDVLDRDDAMSVQMFDTTTGQLVYELSVYHHVSGSGGFDPGNDGPDRVQGEDDCGDEIDDDIGRYGNLCSGGIGSDATFAHWFNDALGTNLSTAHTIELRRNGEGVYEYLTDDFFPIDGQLFGNEGDHHNELFTYAISARFTYDACRDLFFEFEGNDDAWVFIDGRLVIDLGGLATPTRQYVALDRLGLDDGREYRLHFFYAHRRSALDSVFRMRTNIPLRTTERPPVTGTYD